jgi:hypothetical protein
MKIAALVPIGPLDRFGYQYTAALALKNHADFFDRVYVIGSSRQVAALPVSKLVFISDEASLFELDRDGNEILDFPKINLNVNRVKELAKRDGFDLAVEIHINQYVSESNFQGFRDHCRKVLDEKKPFGWVYKSYQYFDKLYYPSHRVPWIANLRDFGTGGIFDSDSIHFGEETHRIQDGTFKEASDHCVVDIMGCYTEKDDEEKFEYYTKVLNRTYGKAGTSTEYSASHYFNYHRIKLLNKRPSGRALGRYGSETLAVYPHGSVGEALVRACGPLPRALFLAKRIGRKFLPTKA